MKSIILSYLLTFVVFLLVDMVWLGLIAKNLYQKHLGSLLSKKVNWTAAIIFYIIYVAGISFFAIYPALSKNSASSAVLLGALLGFFAYATYDLTNLATLKNWPLPIVFIDMLWGAVLTAVVSLSGFYIAQFIS